MNYQKLLNEEIAKLELDDLKEIFYEEFKKVFKKDKISGKDKIEKVSLIFNKTIRKKDIPTQIEGSGTIVNYYETIVIYKMLLENKQEFILRFEKNIYQNLKIKDTVEIKLDIRI